METVAAKDNRQLHSSNRELKEVSHYVTRYEGKMQNLATNFKGKNYLQLVWDSKVPQSEKRWYYFFSLSASDRSEVIKEINQYEKFYKEMGEAIQKVRRSEEEGSSSEVNPFDIICELQELLKKMHDAARKGERFTSSSTLYDLHKSFQKQHAELELVIKRVECVALKSSLIIATEACESAKNEVKSLKEDVQNISKKNDEISEKFDRLSLEHQTTQDTMADVLASNRRMEQTIERLMEFIRSGSA